MESRSFFFSRSSVEVGHLSHDLQGFKHHPRWLPQPKWAPVEVGSLVMNSRSFFGGMSNTAQFFCWHFLMSWSNQYIQPRVLNLAQTMLVVVIGAKRVFWVFFPQEKKPAPKAGTIRFRENIAFDVLQKKIVRFSDVISRSQWGKRPVGHDSNYGMILLMQEMLLTTWDVFQPGAATGMKGNSCTDSAQVIAWWSENTWFQGIGIRGEFLVRIYSWSLYLAKLDFADGMWLRKPCKKGCQQKRSDWKKVVPNR